MLKVIDVDRVTGKIDWEKVAQTDVDAAIIWVGSRGSGADGKLVTDSMCVRNLCGAIFEYIPVGLAFSSQAVTEADAIEEADYVDSILRDGSISPSSIPLPVYVERGWRYYRDCHHLRDWITKKQRTDCVIAFCERIKELGYKPGVCSSEYWFKEMFELDRLLSYSIWVNGGCRDEPDIPHDVWAYTDSGEFDGITDCVFVSWFNEGTR
jgi:GH25 family lysozyme M1 (1,4-beta-N-acetylmuramidase)